LLAGRTVDAIGNAVAPIALGFAVLDLFGSLTSLGLVVGATSLGNVLLLLAGGVVADRLPRAVVLIASNLVAAAVYGVVAVLVITDVAILWPLAALGFLAGAAAAFDFPATAALVPQTVPGPALERANGLIRLSLSTSFIVGASLGGILIAAVGPGPGLAFNAATFVVATGCYARVRSAAPLRDPSNTSSPLADLLEGWNEFRRRTWVWVVVATFFVINAAWVGGFHVLGLAVADLHIGRAMWGFIVGAQSAGALVGALLAGHIVPRRPLVLGMLATTVLAAPLLALALAPRVLVLVPAAFVAGVAITQFGIAWESSLQRHIPPDRLARVASFDALGSFSAIPLGEALVGPAAEHFGLTPVLLVAAMLVVAGSFAALLSRDVRTLGRTSPPG
jgi:MFS family permease